MLILMALVGCGSDLMEIEGIGSKADAKEFSGFRPPKLNVDACPEAPSPDIVLTGSTDVYVGCYRLQARGEVLILTDFALRNIGDDEVLNSVTVGYYNTDMVLTEATAFPVRGVLDFNGIDLRVPALSGTNTQIVIYANMDDGSDATSGMTTRLDWVDDGIEIVGDRSGNVYGAAIATNRVPGVEFEWHESKPTFSLSSASPSGEVPAGRSQVLRFDATASSSGDVLFDTAQFEPNTTDPNGTDWNTCANLGDPSRWTLYNYDDLSAPLHGDGNFLFYGESDTPCEDAPDERLWQVHIRTLGEWLPAGSTQSYALYFDNTGAGAGDTLQIDLVDVLWQNTDSTLVFGGEYVGNLTVTGGTVLF